MFRWTLLVLAFSASAVEGAYAAEAEAASSGPTPELITITIAAIAAVAGMAAALASYLQINASAKAAKASVYLQFSDRYNQIELSQGIRELIQWKADAGEKFVDLWIAQFAERDDRAYQIDRARRVVNRYFDDIVRVYEAGFLNRALLKALADRFGLLVYFDIIVPMNRALLGTVYLDRSKTLRAVRATYNGATSLKSSEQ